MNIFKKFKCYLRLREAVIKADKAHSESGARYYVLPATGGTLIVTDRKNFRLLKQKGYIRRNVTITDLVSHSFYFTPYKDGSRGLSADYAVEKRKNYYDWCSKTKKGGK